MTDWQEEYKRRYARLKEAGKPFFPHAVFKDTVVALILLGALGVLAYDRGAPLESPADPTDTTYNPRPEWYFLFLFQALKFFPGRLEAVATVVLPGLGLLLLLLIPFLDRGPDRHPLDRKPWTGAGLAVLAVAATLTWAGFQSPLTNPITPSDPQVAVGRRLYEDMKCAYCHSIGGKGGKVGPALDEVAGYETIDWLTRHFQDPQAVTPDSTMPKLNLLEDEIKNLIAYLKSLEGDRLFSEEAPRLFTEHCAACHRVGKEGGSLGPDLSLIGSARDKAYLKIYILDPEKANPASSMPGFKEQLTEVQAEDLARYLGSLR